MARLVHIDVVGNEKDIICQEVENNANRFINIKHGMKEGWELRFSLDRRIFVPGEVVNFKNSSFIIKPILKGDYPIKDNNNNIYHVISKNKIRDHKGDTILMLDTLIKFSEFKIVKDASVNIIGYGINVVDGVKVLAPVFEVFEKGKITISDNSNKVTLIVNENEINIL